jgi:hypothetical protein
MRGDRLAASLSERGRSRSLRLVAKRQTVMNLPLLVRQLWRLLHSWWRQDRIRLSPTEGRLLRLEQPCFLVIDGQPFEVVKRTLRPSDKERVAVYAFRTSASELVVRQGLTPEILWQHQGVVRRLHETDIEVFPASWTNREE